MRTLVYYEHKPNKVEVIPVGDRSVIFIREKIKKQTYMDEEGNERVQYQAYEYSTEANGLNLDVDQVFIDAVIAKEAAEMAKSVRAKRDELLAESDNEMLVDRIEHDSDEYIAAIKTYRQALRDIPSQKGFPWDIIFPEKPKKKE